ncbi:aspartyl protease family protein 2-like [Chenopodium quinoa]|uniref:Peptidase A1 domain-containing protein n=1 Tax=Chenopodium quinoa TaxID=63459 RepID=A0A803MU65_CHEQI|nr:aspartyl protease family protein 2-like [Chenopodium quinoa]
MHLFLTFILLLIATTTTTAIHHDYVKLQLIHIKPFKTPSDILLFDTHRIHSLHHRHSLKTPLISGASIGSGQYFAGITIGTPPQNLLLVADTGSDLTWLKCSACRTTNCTSNHPPNSAFFPRLSLSFRPTHCYHPSCQLVPHSSTHCPRPHHRYHSSCVYDYSYADGSTTSGIFSKETTSFNSSSGKTTHVPNLSFGCGFQTSGPAVSDSGFEGASGVMGLGRGPISFTAQLGRRFGNKFSYCLQDYTYSPPPTSYLVIGGGHDVVSTNNNMVQSTPLIHNTLSPTFYYIGIQSVTIDGVKLPISPSVWALDEFGDGGTVIDSGTTLTFVPEPAYRQILTVMGDRVKLPKLSELTQQFDLCFNVSGVFHTRFPRMSFELVGDSAFDPPPRNYFIDVAEDVKCLAIQQVISPSGFAVIGNLMQQGYLFEFDNDSSRLLFSRNGCGGGPRS